MSIIFERLLEKKLSVIVENENLIKPHGPSYDRQYAEDLLHHTIGPLTDNPTWVNKPWNSPNPQPEDYRPGGPAYSWTPEDVIFAFAGNPSKLFEGGADSPSHGRMGGAPMFRAAKKVARKFGKAQDKDFIADLYANGFVPLTKMMKPGFDEGRSPFISYVIRSVIGAMESGPGAEKSSLDVTADDRAQGKLGLRAALKSNDPAQIRAAANTVQGKYQTERSFDKSPENPFGQYSSDYYQTMMAYADALEAGDEDQIEAAQSRISQLVTTIQDANPQIRGAASGLGQAITNKDRKTSIGIASMDNRKDDEADSLGDSMSDDDHEDSWLQPEAVNYILDIALNYDLGSLLPSDSKWTALGAELGAKGGKIGGKMTVNELRYVVRSMGPVGSNYPGEGVIRSNTSIPRDAKGWWKPGEDPEIEPLPNGRGKWNSIWKRNGYAPMQPTSIAAEMTQEVDEFNKLGIPTARKVTEKAKIREAVSKVAVANTVKAARIKLQIIAAIHKDDLGLGESVTDKIPEGLFTDAIDREIIVEHAEYMANILQKSLILEAEMSVPASKKVGLLKKILRELQKPQRPAPQGKGEQTGDGLTRALKYQNKVSKWASKFNEEEGDANPSNTEFMTYDRLKKMNKPPLYGYNPYDGENTVLVTVHFDKDTMQRTGVKKNPVRTKVPLADAQKMVADFERTGHWNGYKVRNVKIHEGNGGHGVPANGNSHKSVATIVGRPGALELNDVMTSENSTDNQKRDNPKVGTKVDSKNRPGHTITKNLHSHLTGKKKAVYDLKDTPDGL